MRLHKNLIIIGLILALSTLIISFSLIINNPNDETVINYWSNVLLAIFGSSVVMVFTSIWGYFSERKRYELQYATFARDFLLRSSRFLNLYNNIESNPKEVNTISGDLHSYYDSFAFEKNYEILGYFFKKSNRKKQMKFIHSSIIEYANELSRISYLSQRAFHNGEDNFTFKTSITVEMLDSTMDLINKLFSL